MKAAAMSVWVFINLLFFGMCGYLYLIWSQYWLYIEKQRFLSKSMDIHKTSSGFSHEHSYFSERYVQSYINKAYNSSILNIIGKNRRSAVGVLWSSSKDTKSSIESSSFSVSPSSIVVKSKGSPRFPNIHQPIIEFDSEKYICDHVSAIECEKRTEEFKDLLLKEFHRVLMGDSKVFISGLHSQNIYNVKYEDGKTFDPKREDILCALKSIKMRTVTSKDKPLANLGYKIPRKPLQEDRLFNSCAVVTSAGTLLGSRLGNFIDSHDMVLRFNNAPTENFTEDVGSKTTIRILNSQVVSKPEFRFLENPLFQDISMLLWDPANHSASLEEWYKDPDFPLFINYKRLLDRKKQDVHLLHPQVLWDLWFVLQKFSSYRLKKNPPSSGFIGIWLSLHRCKLVRVFEYVPSARASSRCHYHSNQMDSFCTLGTWHPLAQEKAIAEKIRSNSDFETFQKGYIDIQGFRDINC